MPESHSAVTLERFASGFTYREYVAQIKVNKDRFDEYYHTCQLSAEDRVFFHKAAQGPTGIAKMLVLAEDWCPDAFRGVPMMARIAEAAGVEMRIFPRDQNPDIMNEFLNQGKFTSIPVVVFYTRDLGHICHWIERPALANRERAEIESKVKQEMPQAGDSELRLAVRERTQSRYPVWQQESVREIRQMLALKLGL